MTATVRRLRPGPKTDRREHEADALFALGLRDLLKLPHQAIAGPWVCRLPRLGG